MTSGVSEFESTVASGAALTRAQAEALLADPDLVTVGMLGEQARAATTGSRVTYGRVLVVDGTSGPAGADLAGEIRLAGAPGSADEAVALVTSASAQFRHGTLTGFSLVSLLNLAGGDHLALAELAGRLRRAGLDGVAELPLDLVADAENAVELVRAAIHGGLAVRRATVQAAGIAARLDLIERAVHLQNETGALRAFAPLPRADPADQPATGYDDVRTVAAARLMARNIPLIQVDWPLYGPKLAQVALAYGANDIDGVAVTDSLNLGHRRSPKEDIERQIRAAGCEPVERDGRYEWPK